MRRHVVKWGPGIVIGVAVAIVAVATRRDAPHVSTRPEPLDMIGSPRSPATNAAGLRDRIAAMEARLAENPQDHGAGIVLAEALVRQARVTGNGAHAARAEQRLREALRSDPGDYDAQRMLGVVLLSLHRFDEAVTAGEKARAMRPDDPFNHGVIGDGLLELGRYEEAFAAFQHMVDMRPSAASYARAAYAQELQGHLETALDTMQRAANATSPRDAEGLAWTLTQIGDLLFRLDRVDEAEARYRLAAKIFPDHPFAMMGLAHVHSHRHQDGDAIALASTLLSRAPSMRLAAFIGDLHARNGRTADAERFYVMAETIGRESASSDESLAGFLAERRRQPADAVAIAERAAATRQDVHTLDALAWAYFRNGQLAEAAAAAEKALRTGIREKRVVLHAAAINAARGQATLARTLSQRALPRDPDFDVLAAEQVGQVIAAGSSLSAVALAKAEATALRASK